MTVGWQQQVYELEQSSRYTRDSQGIVYAFVKYRPQYLMDGLPDELLLHIFSFLKQPRLHGLARVSSRWRTLVYDRTLWKKVCFPFTYRGGQADAVLDHLVTRINRACVTSLDLTNSRVSGLTLYTIMQLLSNLQELTLSSYKNRPSFSKQGTALSSYSLKKLVFVGANCNLTDDDAQAFAVCCTQLEHLEFNASREKLTDRGVIHFATNCHCLRHVSIAEDYRAFNSLTASCINAFGLYCRKLQHFHIDGVSWLGNEPVTSVVINNPALEHLHFRNLSGLTDAGVKTIAESCTKLRELFLLHCYKVSDVGLIALANSCQDIRCFGMTLSKVTDVGTHIMLDTCRLIEHLVLSNNRFVTDDTLVSVAQCLPRLKHLEMCQCSHISHLGVVVVLRHCRHLVTGAFSACESIGDGNSIAHLESDLSNGKEERKTASSLKTLALNLCKQLNDGSLWQMIRLTPSLKDLQLGYCLLLTDDAMLTISRHCPDLESLFVKGCVLVTDVGLRHLTAAVAKVGSRTLFR